ncbi:hypothetical protein DYB28_004097, partial [Aphanomyces astaci]
PRIFVDWSPRAFEHVLKGLRLKNFGFMDSLSATDRQDVEEALVFMKVDVSACGLSNDDEAPGKPMVCPSKRADRGAATTERFDELSSVGDPETDNRFTTSPPPDASTRKHHARTRLEKEARKRRNRRDNYD